MDHLLLWAFALVGALSVFSAGMKLLRPRRAPELDEGERNFVAAEEALLERDEGRVEPYLRLMEFWCERGEYGKAEAIFFRGASRFHEVEAFQAWGPRIFYGSYVGTARDRLPAPPALDAPQSLRVDLRRKNLRLQLGRMLVSDLVEVEHCVVDLRRLPRGGRRRWTYHVRRLEARLPEERLTAWLRGHVNLGAHDLTQPKVRFTAGRIEVSAVYRGVRVPIPFTVLFEIRAVERRHVKITVPRAPGLVGWLPVPTGRLLAMLVETFAPPGQRFIRPLDDHSLLLSPFDPEVLPLDLNLQSLDVEEEAIRITCREDSEVDDPMGGRDPLVLVPSKAGKGDGGGEARGTPRPEGGTAQGGAEKEGPAAAGGDATRPGGAAATGGTGLLGKMASFFGRREESRPVPAGALADHGEWRKMLDGADERLRKNPLDREAWARKIEVLADGQDRHWEALRVAGRALRHLPEDEELLLWQARLFARCERWTEALAAYEALAARRPEAVDRIPYMRAMAQIHRKGTGDLDEARRILETVLKLDPADPESLVDVGDVLVEAGEELRALDWFRQAATVSPFDHIPCARIARLCQSLGREDEAKRAEAVARYLEGGGRSTAVAVSAEGPEGGRAFAPLHPLDGEPLLHEEETGPLGRALREMHERLGWIVGVPPARPVATSPLAPSSAPAFVALVAEAAALFDLVVPEVHVLQDRRPSLAWDPFVTARLRVSSGFFDRLRPEERRAETVRLMAHEALGHRPFLAMGDDELELMAALLRHLGLEPRPERLGWHEALHDFLRGGVEGILRHLLQGARSRRRMRQWIPPEEHRRLHRVCRAALEAAPVTGETIAAWRRSLLFSADRCALRATGDLEACVGAILHVGLGDLAEEGGLPEGLEALRLAEDEVHRRRIAELLRFEVCGGERGRNR